MACKRWGSFLSATDVNCMLAGEHSSVSYAAIGSNMVKADNVSALLLLPACRDLPFVIVQTNSAAPQESE